VKEPSELHLHQLQGFSVYLTNASVSPSARSLNLALAAHSMEEAEQLCDRLGIFRGRAVPVHRNPRELTARYGERTC